MNTFKHRFNQLSIRTQIVILTSAIAISALLLFGISWSIYSINASKSQASQQSQSIATVFAYQLAAALTFNDKKLAEEVLTALQGRKSIEAAFVFGNDEKLFAQFINSKHNIASPESRLSIKIANSNAHQHLIVHAPIDIRNDALGTLYLVSNLDNVQNEIRNSIQLGLVVALAALLLAIILALIFQGLISTPILNLASTAKEISTNNNYDLKAIKQVGGEVGTLYDEFNNMLDHIQHQQTQLQQAHDELEARVIERTQALQAEIEQRQQAQASLETIAFELEERNALLDQSLVEAQAAAQAKSNFLATMSHEIRTPMNGVLGVANILAKTTLNPRQKQQIEMIISSGESLMVILNDILDFSKSESGKLVLEEHPFNLNDLLSSASQMFSETIKAKGIGFHLNIEPSVPSLCIGDLTRIRQVLLNLIGNASKFTKQGGITIDISSQPLDEEYNNITFAVSDTGIGIPKENLASVFDAFTQADSSTTREYGGSGLGLAICSKLAKLMKGTIHVESELGKGSTFYFSIPLKNFAASKLSNATYQTHTIENNPTNKLASNPLQKIARILVVEDTQMNQTVAKEVLAMAGYDTNIAQNGQEAIDYFMRGNYDLILMDCLMPVMDGYESTRRIRALAHPEAKTIPIIALSAHVSKDNVAACKAAGMNDFIPKPFDENNLLEKIAYWLNEYAKG